MGPRNSADYRTLVWIAGAISLVAAEYVWSGLVFYAWPLNLYLAMCCGIIAHNHNHCPIFSGKRLNRLVGHVLTFYYGYPTFVWVPTHNLNHHKHVNRAGDATITWRVTDKHNAWVAWSYFFVSAYYQSFPIQAFLKKAKADKPQLYRRIRWQYAIWYTTWLGMLATGIALHGLRRGIVLWGLSVGLPALFSIWVIMFFNYEQHVHTDPWSAHNHSRNFTGRLLNLLLFNNGYHGVHHEQPGLHWSLLPAAHAKVADQIDPRLCQASLPWFMWKQFVLAPFWPQLGTHQVGRAPFDPPAGRLGSLAADDVELGEAGTNIGMAPA